MKPEKVWAALALYDRELAARGHEVVEHPGDPDKKTGIYAPEE